MSTASKLSILSIIAVCLLARGAQGASHSDAPLIKQDPQANITDVHAFVGTRYDDPGTKVLNVIVHVRPFSEPGDGVIYDRFADDARYSIHIADKITGKTVIRYDFSFSDVNPLTPPGLKNPNTILSYGLGTEVGPIQDVGDARQNFTQTYELRRLEFLGRDTRIGSGLLTAPPNVGKNTTPAYNDSNGVAVSGATSFGALDVYTQQALYTLPSGEAVFAGPREDGFFADTPGIFDLLDARILGPDGFGQTGNGVDGFKGYNVLAYGIQIPDTRLARVPNFPNVGVYASVSRPRVTFRSNSKDPVGGGGFIQVNRMGNPPFQRGAGGPQGQGSLQPFEPDRRRSVRNLCAQSRGGVPDQHRVRNRLPDHRPDRSCGHLHSRRAACECVDRPGAVGGATGFQPPQPVRL
jgi:hypothetical protein